LERDKSDAYRIVLAMAVGCNAWSGFEFLFRQDRIEADLVHSHLRSMFGIQVGLRKGMPVLIVKPDRGCFFHGIGAQG
jgi:hypothetical protein